VISAPRILFYAHALLGVGHVKRSALLAEALTTQHGASCHLVGCQRGLHGTAVPAGLETLALPDWPEQGAPDAGHVCRQRTELIRGSVEAFDPDVFVVDHLFLGLGGELLPLLQGVAQRPDAMRLVIGLPYGPRAGVTGPRNRRIRDAMARYEVALCYTDARCEQPAEDFERHGFPIPSSRRYVGYVVPPGQLESLTAAEASAAQPPLVVALAGGGSTGPGLFALLLSALGPQLESGRVRVRLVLGPLYGVGNDPAPLRRAGVEVLERASLEKALSGASAVVSRCGYNNAYALIKTGLPTVFCPFDDPSSDQIQRAEALSRLDRVWAVAERAGEGEMLAVVTAALEAGRGVPEDAIDCEGAAQGAAELVRIARSRGGT
jgi:predicted glycosyltransferase